MQLNLRGFNKVSIMITDCKIDPIARIAKSLNCELCVDYIDLPDSSMRSTLVCLLTSFCIPSNNAVNI